MSNRPSPQSPRCDSAIGGNEEARQHLLSEQLPLVQYVARRIHGRLPRHVPLEDLVNAGVVGLMDAFCKFDNDKHVPFASYAKFRIRGAILDSLRELDWGPRDLRRQSRRIEEAHSKLQAALGRYPTEPELACELQIELPEFHKQLREINALEICSLHFKPQDDGTEKNLCEYLPSVSGVDPFVQCLNSEARDLLTRAISELPEKECKVVKLYYFEELTMREIGIALGVGESRVSQIHSTAMMQLKARMAEFVGVPVPAKKRAAAASR